MVADLLVQLRNAGLNLSRDGDQLIVEPRQRLTDELREAVRSAKKELLAALPDLEDAPLGVALSPIQEAAQADVLSQLARNPAVQRAFVNRFEPDGTMIVTLAIRGVGTGELKIPAARFNQASLNDYAVLLGCIEGAA
jgi:hypothetical protein